MTRRTILIGDLHGCLDEALELLDACKATANDQVIFLGDLVDRGPNSAGCVDLAMTIERRQSRPACVLGNHEEKALSYEMLSSHGLLNVEKMHETHRSTRDQLRPEHYDYLRRLPLFIRMPEYKAVAVHAGVYPGRPIEEQTPRHLLHIQSIRPPDERSFWCSRVPANEKGWAFWSQFWNGSERVFFGHSVLDRPLITDKVVGLDGGAVFGRELWAYILPDEKVVAVKSRVNYHNGDRKLVEVHDGVQTFS